MKILLILSTLIVFPLASHAQVIRGDTWIFGSGGTPPAEHRYQFYSNLTDSNTTGLFLGRNYNQVSYQGAIFGAASNWYLVSQDDVLRAPIRWGQAVFCGLILD